jgi:hypothetical protein
LAFLGRAAAGASSTPSAEASAEPSADESRPRQRARVTWPDMTVTAAPRPATASAALAQFDAETDAVGGRPT